MPDMPIDERTFTDAEVREILKKAVERAVRQRSPGATSTDVARSEGLNLAELKAIAAEVGIDGAHLEDAARAVVQVGGNRPSRLLGGPRVLNFERTVPGEIRSADTQEIVSRIRRLMGHQGEVAEIGGALEWSAKAESGERHVSVWSRDGRTTVRASANLTNAAVLTYVPAGAASVVTSLLGLGIVLNGDPVGLIVGLAAPVLYPILRTVFKRVTKSEENRLERVVDEVAAQVRE